MNDITNAEQTRRRPRAVWVSGTYPPTTCGVADGTFFLANQMAADGYDVSVWTERWASDAPPVTSGPAVEIVDVVERWDAAGMRALRQRVLRERPPLIHLQYEIGTFNQNPGIGLLALAARQAGTRLVTTFHALDGPRRWGRAHRLGLIPLLLGSHDILVCAPKQIRALKRLPAPIARKSHLIPTGNNIAVIPAPPRRATVTDRPLELAYFGFVWRGKNIESAINALAHVHAAVPGGARLTVIGAVRDDAYREHLLRLAGERGVAGRVAFPGDLPPAQISAALHRADVALLPFPTGISTGHGTLMAALAHGLPIVSMSKPENMDPLFVDGDNMLLAPAGDDPAFAAQAVRVARDAALRETLSRGAARLAGAFSWESIVAQMRALPSYRAARAREQGQGSGGGGSVPAKPPVAAATP